jgi:hypothetical protein
MSKRVDERIGEVRDRIVAAGLKGGLSTPEEREYARDLLHKTIRRAIALRIYDLWKENVAIIDACRIATQESGLKVPENDVIAMARNLEANWESFVATAPVEIVSDAEFAELLQSGNGKGRIIA